MSGIPHDFVLKEMVENESEMDFPLRQVWYEIIHQPYKIQDLNVPQGFLGSNLILNERIFNVFHSTFIDLIEENEAVEILEVVDNFANVINAMRQMFLFEYYHVIRTRSTQSSRMFYYQPFEELFSDTSFYSLDHELGQYSLPLRQKLSQLIHVDWERFIVKLMSYEVLEALEHHSEIPLQKIQNEYIPAFTEGQKITVEQCERIYF